MVKKSEKVKKIGNVYHSELFGLREIKYHELLRNDVTTIGWTKLDPKDPYWYFVKKDERHRSQYQAGFSISDLFPTQNSGIKTDRDDLFIAEDPKALANRFKLLLSGHYDDDFKEKYRVIDSGSYKITSRLMNKSFDVNAIRQVIYRPFDCRYIYYDNEIVSRPAYRSMKHILYQENYCLCFMRQYEYDCGYCYILITNRLVESRIFISNKGIALTAPLYLYPENVYGQLSVIRDKITTWDKPIPNLNLEIVSNISSRIGLPFTTDNESPKSFNPIVLLDYVYATLHSPFYRERYREFLKTDFPRVPYPKDSTSFFVFAKKGARLRKLHLMDTPELEKLITSFPVSGSNSVEKVEYDSGRVFINNTQYFGNVPSEAWDFWLGGYQPARKWLKDRKAHILSAEEILHWQRIILSLSQTAKIMKEIDAIQT